MIYVYTKLGEQHSKENGFYDRLENEIAFCGYRPVSGSIAIAWLKRGYIKEKGEHQ